MKAAFLEAPRQLVVRDVERPNPKPGEVRVQLQQVGICGSDVHLFCGHRLLENPTVIGHEGIGVIDKAGAGVSNRKVGDRVAIEPNIPCGHCTYCMGGRGNICINKRVIGLTEQGCFAEYVCLPAHFSWPIPDSIDDTEAVCIEPTAVCVHALFTSSARPGDTIAIVGLGAIGLILTHLAIRLGYRVCVSELNPNKLQLAVRQGAVSVQGDTDTINKIWTTHDVTAVFECAGSAAAATLVAAAAPRGSEIVLVGLSGEPAAFTPLKISREGITLIPSIIYDHPTDFRRAIRLIEQKTIAPGFIVSSYATLDTIQHALERAGSGEETKVVVRI